MARNGALKAPPGVNLHKRVSVGCVTSPASPLLGTFAHLVLSAPERGGGRALTESGS